MVGAGNASHQTQQQEFPEERLAFALADGRVGVLSVKGRKVVDTRPKRPMWGVLASAEVIATAVASWGSLVVFGDAEGMSASCRHPAH